MRYLRKYNESVSIRPEIEDACKDILVDLEDEGFDVGVFITTSNDFHGKKKIKSNIKIAIGSGKSGRTIDDMKFKYSEISETIDRLSSYLESEGYSLLNIHGYNIRGGMDQIRNSSSIEYIIRYFEV